jgi:hypothetical protein
MTLAMGFRKVGLSQEWAVAMIPERLYRTFFVYRSLTRKSPGALTLAPTGAAP